MSSVFGHSLVACSLASGLRHYSRSWLRRLIWAGWLVVLASAPDVDYLILSLGSPVHRGLRITHSLAFGLILPLCTVAVLYLAGNPGRQRRLLSACAVLAGLSHLVLDFLVGVTPLPLLWPLSAAAFASPLGILPSAGRIQLSNYYFYRNLLIEVGILMPIIFVAKESSNGRVAVAGRIRAVVLLMIAGCFIAWSIGLSR